MTGKAVQTVEYVTEYEDDFGYPFLQLRIDGARIATIYIEQPMARDGLLSLGDIEFPEYEATVPASPRDNRPEWVAVGATDHPDALRLYWEWWHRVNEIPGEGPP